MSVAKKLWILSWIITAIFFIVLMTIILRQYHSYNPDSEQLINLQAAKQFILDWQEKYKIVQPPTLIPTGLFLESLRFVNSQTVHITGYIWQRIPKNSDVEPGFVLPEANDIKQEVAYQLEQNNEKVIGWYIETQLVHAFDYKKYPLDHKIVWLRIWPKDFSANVILMPDLDAYDSTFPNDKFGLDPNISIDGYSVLETFFRFNLSSYDTNFGISNYVGQKDNPELYYNIVLKRAPINSLIIHVLPISLIVILMFFLVLLMSLETTLNITRELSLQAMLLFVVLLSHIQLRGMFSGTEIVYIEYIYFIVYFLILYLLIVSYLLECARKNPHALKWIQYENNIIPKVLFFPLTFGLVLWATLAVL